MVALEGVMETSEEVAVIRQLLELVWSRRLIATQLGISRHTVSRFLHLGEWQPYSTANRSRLSGPRLGRPKSDPDLVAEEKRQFIDD